MSFFRRRIYFIIALIIFVSLLPVLVIYSLGYNINFLDRSIETSLNIRLETIPISPKVIVNDKTISEITPTDIRVLGEKNIQLEVKKDGYASEKFLLSGEADTNTSTQITSLYLLNTEFSKLNNFDSEDTEYVYFVGDQILIKYNQNNNIEIRPIASLGSLSSSKVNQINQISFDQDPSFEDLENDTFFDFKNRILLWEGNLGWNILDLKTEWQDLNLETNQNLSEFNINSIASINDNNVLFTNKNNYLYQLNLDNYNISIIDTQTVAVGQTTRPNNFWIFNESGVSKISGFDFNENNDIIDIELENLEIFNTHIFKDLYVTCREQNDCKFMVRNSLAGNLILLGDTLYYYQSNEGSEKLLTISKNVSYLVSKSGTAFYSTYDNSIYSYNTIINQTLYLGTLPNDENIEHIDFIDDWKRILITQKNNTYSIWYDKDINNYNIIQYSLVNWSANSCNRYIFDLTLSCLQEDNEIIYYQNNKLF